MLQFLSHHTTFYDDRWLTLTINYKESLETIMAQNHMQPENIDKKLTPKNCSNKMAKKANRPVKLPTIR